MPPRPALSLHNKPELLDTTAAAEYIGMSPVFLRCGRYRGVVGRSTPTPPYLKIGTAVKYLRTDLGQWLAERRVDPARRLVRKAAPRKAAVV